jgi:hypothetical protein
MLYYLFDELELRLYSETWVSQNYSIERNCLIQTNFELCAVFRYRNVDGNRNKGTPGLGSAPLVYMCHAMLALPRR